ncbi:hypothetical protein ET532_009045 [Verminephrobacter sp. Larva24]|nr:hypothetical protein ET532_009045 [Verminephrobacter sp. Larva24]
MGPQDIRYAAIEPLDHAGGPGTEGVVRMIEQSAPVGQVERPSIASKSFSNSIPESCVRFAGVACRAFVLSALGLRAHERLIGDATLAGQ